MKHVKRLLAGGTLLALAIAVGAGAAYLTAVHPEWLLVLLFAAAAYWIGTLIFR